MSKIERAPNKQKPRWLKKLRQPFPRQIEKAYSTDKGKHGYTRGENKRILKRDILDMEDDDDI